MSISVLDLCQMCSRFWRKDNNLHNVEHHQGEIVSNRERARIFHKLEQLYVVFFGDNLPPGLG